MGGKVDERKHQHRIIHIGVICMGTWHVIVVVILPQLTDRQRHLLTVLLSVGIDKATGSMAKIPPY